MGIISIIGLYSFIIPNPQVLLSEDPADFNGCKDVATSSRDGNIITLEIRNCVAVGDSVLGQHNEEIKLEESFPTELNILISIVSILSASLIAFRLFYSKTKVIANNN